MQESVELKGPQNIANGGVLNGRSLTAFKHEGPTVVTNIYADTNSGRGHNLVVWCLEPGQENSLQWHETITHIFVIQEGEGVYMKGEPFKAEEECPKETAPAPASGFTPTLVPIKAGDTIFIPERTIHGIRNTGASNLSYLAVSIGENYSRIDVGSQMPSYRA
jgi:oxalate decarboxylase/phosphoglucose isomerase-like protein (cupin superfamily)